MGKSLNSANTTITDNRRIPHEHVLSISLVQKRKAKKSAQEYDKDNEIF